MQLDKGCEGVGNLPQRSAGGWLFEEKPQIVSVLECELPLPYVLSW